MFFALYTIFLEMGASATAADPILPVLPDAAVMSPDSSETQVDQSGRLLAKFWSQDAWAVGTVRTTSGEIVLSGIMGQLTVEIVNLGANAVNVFSMEVKPHPSGTWTQVATAADWASPDHDWVDGVESNPSSLSAGATTVLVLLAQGAYAIRFTAAAAANTTLSVRTVAQT